MPDDPAAVRQQPLLPKVSRKKFARTPQTVLAARTKLGLEDQDRPDDAATAAQLADWLHLNTMAGEWEALAWFLAERAGDEAPAIYSHIIQSTNQGDPMLLPEEVLALANAAPGEPTNWQIDVLGQLLVAPRSDPPWSDAREHSRGHATLRWSGCGEPPTDRGCSPCRHAREAYDYLPDLDRAREEGDGRAILITASTTLIVTRRVRRSSCSVRSP